VKLRVAHISLSGRASESSGQDARNFDGGCCGNRIIHGSSREAAGLRNTIFCLVAGAFMGYCDSVDDKNGLVSLTDQVTTVLKK